MNVLDLIKERTGLSYEDLNPNERETVNTWMESLQKSQLTLEKVKDYVVSMRESVELEISKEPAFIWVLIFKVENPKLVKLQARLFNYLLLEGLLVSPERAKQTIELAISGLSKK